MSISVKIGKFLLKFKHLKGTLRYVIYEMINANSFLLVKIRFMKLYIKIRQKWKKARGFSIFFFGKR